MDEKLREKILEQWGKYPEWPLYGDDEIMRAEEFTRLRTKLEASKRALVLAVAENVTNFHEAELLRAALVRLMYWMDIAREGGVIDLEAFNRFWGECQNLVRTVESGEVLKESEK